MYGFEVYDYFGIIWNIHTVNSVKKIYKFYMISGTTAS